MVVHTCACVYISQSSMNSLKSTSVIYICVKHLREKVLDQWSTTTDHDDNKFMQIT